MAAGEHDISWALKLLEREAEYEPNILAANWGYICGTLTGIGLPMLMNKWLKRPVWNGIHQHFLLGIAGFAFGHMLTVRDDRISARRDAIMRDYITLHPEDFPPPDTKKYRDIFDRWGPVR